MAGVVRAMDAAMKGMNLEKISSLMDKFEQQFEDLDVQSSYMENTMSQTTTTAVPQGDVDALLSQVADEAGYVNIIQMSPLHGAADARNDLPLTQCLVVIHRLELNMELPNGPQASAVGGSTQVSQEQDELSQRLARLRQTE